ncbi:hypothetical protein PT274_01535 [Leuconostocaceae bacterium ESL0958]|nr:hypothetical protein [Leuconostocaceae bacterium ESL0958]
MNTVELEFLNYGWNSRSVRPSPLYYRKVKVSDRELKRLKTAYYQNNLFAWFKKFEFVTENGRIVAFRGSEITGLMIFSNDVEKIDVTNGNCR